MNKRIVISVSDDYQAKICRKLSHFDEITICGVIDWRQSPDNTLPSVDGFLLTHDYIVSIHEKNYVFTSPSQIPKGFYIDIGKYESFFLKMTDRLAYYPICTTELSSIFHKFCLFWLHLYKKYNIDTVIFFATPHMGFDFVGYAVAEVLRLDIRILNRTGLTASSKMTNSIDLWNSKSNHQIAPAVSNQIGSSKAGLIDDLSDFSLVKSVAINDHVFKQHAGGYRFIAHILVLLFKISVATARTIFMRVSRKSQTRRPSVFWLSGPRSFVGIFYESLIRAIKTHSILKYYKNACLKKLPDRKFILFAAHFQPERSTMPEGGVFDDHLKAIDLLASLIPKEYIIIFKEHPRQFDLYDLRRRFARTKKFYDSINAYDQVFLVSPFWNNSELISKSVAVATVTGSSGWEALRNCKQCIIFGDAWYRECRSCLHVSEMDSDSLSQFLKLDGYEVSKRIEVFLIEAQKNLVNAPNAAHFLPKHSAGGSDDYANTIASALYGSLR